MHKSPSRVNPALSLRGGARRTQFLPSPGGDTINYLHSKSLKVTQVQMLAVEAIFSLLLILGGYGSLLFQERKE
jgi:hypothetical protein